MANIVEKQRELLAKASYRQRQAAMKIIEGLNLATPALEKDFALELVDPAAKATRASASE